MTRVWVPGTPIPQGSKSVSKSGHAYEANKKTRPWRATVADCAAEARASGEAEMLEGPVAVSIAFYFQKPKSAKKSAVYNEKKPDIDKLCRAIFDSITGILIPDDSRVVCLTCVKYYAGGLLFPGTRIEISRAENP